MLYVNDTFINAIIYVRNERRTFCCYASYTAQSIWNDNNVPTRQFSLEVLSMTFLTRVTLYNITNNLPT